MRSLACALVVSAFCPAARGQCLEFMPGFEVDGVLDSAYVALDFAGELVVGGEFLYTGQGAAQRIARWNGSQWRDLGEGLDAPPFCMAVFDDGSGAVLYVGGAFTQAGGAPAAHLARWNGEAWSSVGGGLNDTPFAMAVYDDGSGPALYVAGAFTSAGGIPASRIARWDGTSWSQVGGGVEGQQTQTYVLALEVFDHGTGPGLFAGGNFETAGGVPVANVARWDGASWSDPGGGVGSPGGCSNGVCQVSELELHDDGSGEALYVGGAFDEAGGVPAGGVARWDGSAWSAVGTGVLGNASSLVSFDDGTGPALYCGSSVTPDEYLWRWDGATWSHVGGALSTNVELALYDDGTGAELYAFGSFEAIGSLPVHNIARWSPTAWTTLGSGNGLDDRARAFAVFDDGTGEALYAGGAFTVAGGAAAGHVARWDGSSWSSVGSPGTNGNVDALAAFDDGSGPALYAGGSFTEAGGQPADSVARWDGAAWSAVGGGLPGTIRALTVHDDGSGPALYAGGALLGAGQHHVARWDGTAWSGVGALNGPVNALASWEHGGATDLYAGGSFTAAGGQPASLIARWDGTAWTALGPGLSMATTTPQVDALAVFDGSLFAAGAFQKAGALTVERIARWDGSAWSALGSGLDSRALALAAYDDGEGPALYAGGKFHSAGGVPAERLARWDGSSWSSVGDLDKDVEALFVHGDGSSAWPSLFAGGPFHVAGGTGSHGVARLSNPCACTGTPYCTAGTTASGCTALISSSGTASRSSASGFAVTVSQSEGKKDGTMFFSTNGAQANSWGNGTSFQCVVPPVTRTGVLQGVGTLGACDGQFTLDFNAWMTSHQYLAPEAGETVYLQCWFRDPLNTSNQSTSLSEALRFLVCP